MLNDAEIRALLRAALPAASAGTRTQDTWTLVRGRLHQRPTRASTIDFALLTAVALLCMLRPSVIAPLLLHF
jgi:hypothetical protein